MFTSAELLSYLDEVLPAEMMAGIEEALRRDSKLTAQLTDLIARRDAGVHSLAEIWRRHRLTCLTREQLGSHLLGILGDDEAGYITFHLETIGCRYCQANLDDLKSQQAQSAKPAATDNSSHRRRKYFQSSAGHLQTAKR